MTDLGPLTTVVKRTLGRVRLQRALESLAVALSVSFALGALVRVVQRYVFFRDQNEPLWWMALALIAAMAAWCWPLKVDAAATRLDSSHDFHDRVRTALDFANRKQRTRFMDAAIQDAIARASSLSARRAAPFRAPRAGSWVIALGTLWLVAGMLPARQVQAVERPRITRVKPLGADELGAFREELVNLERAAALSSEQESRLRSYRALLDRMARGELDRASAIEALLSLEKRLSPEGPYDLSSDQTALSELAKDLAKADETLAAALNRQEPKAAADALEALAKELENKSESERARIKEALERIKRKAEASAQLRKRQEELESLLKRAQAPKTPEEKRLLERNKRELERLRRDNQAAVKRSRELERLERNLSDAAQGLNDQAGAQASEAMKRGAEDLRRLDQQRGTREQQEALAKQVAQLREMLQRQREESGGNSKDQQQSGTSQSERIKRFVMRAGGERDKDEQTQLLLPKPGNEKGQDGEQAQGEGPNQDGKDPGQNGKDGKDGKQGAQGKPAQPALMLGGEGPANAVLELPSIGQSTQASPGSDEHDTHRLKTGTDMDSELRDSQVAGTSSKGPARSEVILDAADRGFATAPYRKVYSDYRSHAEEVLDKEDIPAGYRFYVRRYFQLIRPREERKAP